jgi:hypothetical protein
VLPVCTYAPVTLFNSLLALSYMLISINTELQHTSEK